MPSSSKSRASSGTVLPTKAQLIRRVIVISTVFMVLVGCALVLVFTVKT